MMTEQALPNAVPSRRADGTSPRSRYRRTTLENGIRVVTERTPGARSIALGILVDASPHHEAPEQSGLAHLTEHMMFQGTSRRNARQIAHMMDLAGGNIGGFTTRDYTCYFSTILDEHLPYSLELLGDLLLNTTFPEENLLREKQAILREICGAADAPEILANDLLKASVWPDHPLGRPIVGRPQTVSRLTREDIIYFTHRHYLPDAIIVAAAGSLDHDDFTEQVRDGFWRMLGTTTRIAPAPRSQRRRGVCVEHRPVSQTYFSVGIPAHPYTHESRYAHHILANLLGGGISSRLYRRLREESGLVYNIGAEYQAYRDDGLLVIEGSTAPEHLLRALGLVFVELWRLAASGEPIDDEELWKAKMHIRGQHLLGSENSSTLMSRLATQEFYFGRHIPSEAILDEIERVDGPMLARVGREDLAESLGHPTVAVVGPEGSDSCTAAAVEALLDDFSFS
jgi:predicted Zn-dependent peptidase